MSLAVRPTPAGALAARRSFRHPLRRTGLTVFFASIAVNAGLAIYALVSPGFGGTQAKILGTSLCVTGAIVVALACEPAWERGLLGPVPYAGTLAAAVGFSLAIGGIWAEPNGSFYGRLVGSVFALVIACTLASLLALARLAPNHRWLARMTFALLAVGTTMYAVVFWLGDDPSTAYLRVMGVVLVVFAAFAVTVPVLHWIDRGTEAIAGADGAVRFCPYCGNGFEGSLETELRCARCGRAFTVRPAQGRYSAS